MKTRTKQEVLQLARILYPCKKLNLTENAQAKTKEQRTKDVEISRQLSLERDVLKEDLMRIPNGVADGSLLLKAAEFVVDVNGDDPSITELRQAVNHRKLYLEITERISDMQREIRNRQGGLYSRRFTVSIYGNSPFPHNVVIEQGDTLNDVYDALQTTIEKKGLKSWIPK